MIIDFIETLPERLDEIERIHEAGGRFIYQNGVWVYGILNMSCSLGNLLFIIYNLKCKLYIYIFETINANIITYV